MVIFKEKSLKPLDASKENNSVHQARQLESIPVISSTESNRSKDQVSLEELEYLMSTTLTATEKKKQKNKKRLYFFNGWCYCRDQSAYCKTFVQVLSEQ